MFCSKCGAKLPQNKTKCPSCGVPVESTEYCGGFWGLVNAAPVVQPAVAAPAAPNPAIKAHEDSASRKKQQQRIRILYGVCTLLLFLFLVQSIRIAVLSGRVSSLNLEKQHLTTQKTDLESQIDLINEAHDAEISSKNDEISAMSDEISALSDEISAMSEALEATEPETEPAAEEQQADTEADSVSETDTASQEVSTETVDAEDAFDPFRKVTEDAQ